MVKTVLFACVHNAGRSQMSAGLFNKLADPKKARAISAGTQPAEHVHPEVLATMEEVGIDLSSSKPKFLSADLAATADLLVTMGCGDACPYVAGLEIQDWFLPDPKSLPIERVREIRDEIRKQIVTLIETRGWK